MNHNRRYTIEDEQQIYVMRRIEKLTEAVTATKLNIPQGSIGTLLGRYEKRLANPVLLQELVEAHNLCVDSIMTVAEDNEFDITDEQVQRALDHEDLLPPKLVHKVFEEYDLDSEVLTMEDQKTKPFPEKITAVDKVVNQEYDVVLGVIEDKISQLVEAELDHLKVPVEVLTGEKDALTLEDVQNLFLGFKTEVRDQIVKRLIGRLKRE